MECSCEISIYNDETAGGFVKDKILKARKQHRCCECNRIIHKHEEYEYTSGVWDNEFATFKTCFDCKSIRDVFFHSWSYELLWEDFKYRFDGPKTIIPESCIAALTPNARAKVCEFIELKWKE